MRRVLITGSRDWVDRTSIWNVLRSELEMFGAISVVHGAARGADDIADRWAWGMLQAGYEIEVDPHPADWDQHGKAAGVIRNQQMVDLGADVCHAFPLDGSIGTRHCMSIAMAVGISVVNHGFQPYTDEARDYAYSYYRRTPKPTKEYSL